MATYYLSPSGSDTTGTGSTGNPWKTIAYADAHITAGDTVRLKAGTYTTSVGAADAIVTTTSGTSGSHITWTADVLGTVFLVSIGTSTTLWRSKGNYVDHIGFDLTSGGTALSYGLAIEGSNVSVKNCVAHDIKQNACNPALGGAGIYAGNPTYTNTHVDITECKTYNIGPSGCYYTHGIFHCVQFGNVYNNISFGNGGQGIQYHHNAGNSNCANNLCFNNDHGGIFVGNTGANGTANAANMVVENNICLNNGGCNGGIADSNGNASNTYKNNCSYNNSVGNLVIVLGTTTGNIQVDPLLVNYQADGSGNYRLKTGSPCINAGITAGAPTIDYDGIARGGTVDIGPYEFKPGGSRNIPTSAAFSGPTPKTRTIPTTASLSVPGAPTLPALSVHLPGPSDVSGLIGSISIEQRIDDPATASFTVPDFVGIAAEAHQAVQLIDDATGNTLFSGFVDTITDQALPGNTAILMRAFACTGNRWRAEKRIWTGQELGGWVAGDALAKFHQDVLSAEGVVAAYALRHDHDQTSFGQGTLAGVVATPAGLTLAASGTDYNKNETGTSDFTAGTLTNVAGTSGSLSLTTYVAIKFVGSAGANLDNNALYTFFKIWQAGSGYTFVTGDTISLDSWIASTSPEIKMGIDILFSDGTWMHDYSTDFQDQEVIPMVGDSDLTGWASDQWYTRVCTVPATRAGKVVMAFYLTIRGAKGGNYVGYFKNIIIANAAGVAQRTIFGPTSTGLAAKVLAGTSGYYNVGASFVTVYAGSGVRLSPAYDLSAVGIVKGSMIAWGERDAVQPTTGGNQSYLPQVQVATSMDNGATWQPCTNHAPIPSLILGMNTSGVSLQIQQTLAVGGPLPEVGPFLDTCSFQVYSAAACTKTDYQDIDATTGALGGGTLTNATAYSSGLKTTGLYRNWQTGTLTSMTLYGLSGAGNPQMGIQTNYLFLRTDSGLDVRSRFDFTGASTYQNFIAAIDVHIVSSGANNEYELLYRTTGWFNANNTFAYVAGLTATSVTLRRGTNNSTGGAITVIQDVALSLNVGGWYRLKVVVNGSNHKVFVNDVKFIDVTDATFTAAGYLGVRFWNGGAVRDSGHFNNFAVIAYEADFISVSSRVTAATALGGIVGNSRISWNADVPPTSDLLVESTLDGGATWATCTNGSQIPSLLAGYNAAGKSLQVRFTMTNQTISQPVAIHGYSAWVIGAFTSTGTRISPALDLSPAGSIGSSSITWDAQTAVGSSVAVSTSLDDVSWTAVATSPGTIAGLVPQGPMLSDDFDFDSSAQYTRSSWSGGVSPVFLIDTANSNMTVTSGTNGRLTWTTAGTVLDVRLELVTSQCEKAGLFFRAIDANNLYYVIFNDDASGTNPGTVEIRKRVAGVDSQIFAPIAMPDTFTRGMYHALQVSMFDDLITCSFDGVVVASITDGSLTTAGTVGIYHNSPVSALWFNFRVQQQGDDATGRAAYSKLALASTDPTQNPLVEEVVLSVRNPNIMTGALLDATQYADRAISDDIADAAGRSKMYWRIDGNAQLIMMDRAYSPAPWPLDAQDPLFLGVTNPPQLVRRAPLYRNRQYVTGAIDLQQRAESKKGDGSAQAWGLSYPIDSIIAITLDTNPQTFGVQGVASLVNFYYQPGQNTLSADASLFPEDGSLITITYIGRVPYRAMKEDQGQQRLLQGIDGTSGIVEKSEDCGGLPSSAADAIAQARIDEYAILDSSDWTYSTTRPGLSPGHFQSVFVPQHGMHDTDVLITAVVTTPWLDGNGTMHYDYDITATSGANLGVWQRIFKLAT